MMGVFFSPMSGNKIANHIFVVCILGIPVGRYFMSNLETKRCDIFRSCTRIEMLLTGIFQEVTAKQTLKFVMV